MRATYRYQRTLATRVRVAIAAVQLRAHLPPDLTLRLAQYPEELMPPPRPVPLPVVKVQEKTQSDAGHRAPVPVVGCRVQSRDAHGRFLPRPRPDPSERRAECETARLERAALAPWRAAIKRARLVKRLLTYQAQNARRAQQAQHTAQRLPPDPCPAGGMPPSGAIVAASRSVAPLVPRREAGARGTFPPGPTQCHAP
jgi:hypothetical protein